VRITVFEAITTSLRVYIVHVRDAAYEDNVLTGHGRLKDNINNNNNNNKSRKDWPATVTLYPYLHFLLVTVATAVP
jgi:hypothetical protein